MSSETADDFPTSNFSSSLGIAWFAANARALTPRVLYSNPKYNSQSLSRCISCFLPTSYSYCYHYYAVPNAIINYNKINITIFN